MKRGEVFTYEKRRSQKAKLTELEVMRGVLAIRERQLVEAIRLSIMSPLDGGRKLKAELQAELVAETRATLRGLEWEEAAQ